MRISACSSDVCSSDLLDIDTPALALGRLAMLPCREILAARDDNHIAPSLIEIGVPALRDPVILHLPEGIGVGEIAVFAEQVGADGQHASLDVDTRLLALDRRAAARKENRRVGKKED